MRHKHKSNVSTVASIGFIVWALFVLVIGVAMIGGIFWFVGTFLDGVENDCKTRCDGRDQDVASYTIYGCECKDNDAPTE